MSPTEAKAIIAEYEEQLRIMSSRAVRFAAEIGRLREDNATKDAAIKELLEERAQW